MLTYLNVADSSGTPVQFHQTAGRALTGATGLPGVLGFSGAREATYARPWGHGSINRGRYQNPGVLTLEGYVRGNTPDLALAQYDAITIPLIDALDHDTLISYQRGVDGTGEELQVTARLKSDDFGVTPDAAGRVLRYQVHLELPDPRGYTQALGTATGGTVATSGGAVLPRTIPVTFDQGTGGTLAVNNTGTRPTPPTFRIYGYCTTPKVLLVGTSAQIALTGAIAPGDYVEVNVAARKLTLNGTSPAQYLLDAANTTWFDLPRGTSTIRLLVGANDTVARVDALYRPAYA